MSVNIEDDVLAGAWKSLCAGVLLQAVYRLASESNLFHRNAYVKPEGAGGVCKELLNQRRDARAWMDGGVGVVTYEDCCEALGVDPERARKKILAYCEARKRRKLPSPNYWE